MPPTQLRQKKVVLLGGLDFVKESENHRLLPQFVFSSSASSSTLPVPVIVTKWLCRLPRPTAIPKSWLWGLPVLVTTLLFDPYTEPMRELPLLEGTPAGQAVPFGPAALHPR